MVEGKVRKPRVSIQKGDFIKKWNSSKTVKEAAVKTGMSYAGVRSAAIRYAGSGTSLKKLLICADTVPA